MTRISPDEYTASVEKIAKINARAVRKGFTGRVEVTAERVEVTETNNVTGLTLTHIMYDAEITGQAPSYGGWTLAAVLDFDPEVGLIVNTAPGVDHVNREGLVAGNCAHCHLDRDRRKAYLVRNVATGEEVQVGSTCIKDFLGWSGHLAFLGSEDIKEVEDGWGTQNWADARRYTVDSVLAVAWAAIKAHGWMPASGYGRTTRDIVGLVLNPPSRPSAQDVEEIRSISALAETEDILARAAEVRAFLLSSDFAGEGEYVINLKALAAADSVKSAHLGLLVSAPQAHAKHLLRTLVATSVPASEWFGNVGDKKVWFTGTITNVRYIESAYGTSVLYVIRNMKDGVEVKWFASREALGDKQGVEVTIEGTIKAHEEYRGLKSTVFTRCRAL